MLVGTASALESKILGVLEALPVRTSCKSSLFLISARISAWRSKALMDDCAGGVAPQPRSQAKWKQLCFPKAGVSAEFMFI